MQLLRKLFRDLILVSVVMIVFGAVLVLWPNHTLTIAVQAVGVCIALGGLLSVIEWLRSRQESSYFSLAGGVLAVIAGLYLFTRPAGVISFFPTVAGLAILANGVINLLKALDLKKAGYGSWLMPVLMAAATIAFGFMIFTNPFGTMGTLVRIGGLVLIYNGVSNIWLATRA